MTAIFELRISAAGRSEPILVNQTADGGSLASPVADLL